MNAINEVMPSRFPSPCPFCGRNKIAVARVCGHYICGPCLDKVEWAPDV